MNLRPCQSSRDKLLTRDVAFKMKKAIPLAVVFILFRTKIIAADESLSENIVTGDLQVLSTVDYHPLTGSYMIGCCPEVRHLKL